MSILHDLVSDGNNLERIRELLGAGENPNSQNDDGNTPLHIASLKVIISLQDLEENLRVARELINFGAGVDNRNRFGYSPIHYAINRQKLEMVQYLLQANAQIDIRNNRNETPLILAAKIQNFQIVKELLKQYPSVNLQDSGGNSAMHYALDQPSVDVNMIVELLRHGCEHSVRNRENMMPLDIYINRLDSAPLPEILKARYLLKLFLLFQSNVFKTAQSLLIQLVDLKNTCHLYRFYRHCREEIAQTKHDYIAPDYTVYGIALSGFSYSLSKINNHIPFDIYDKVLDRLIKGKYPMYCDIIVSGICTTYLKKKFADRCCCVENNKEFFHFDMLYLISSYLSHLDMLNMMIACSSS